MALLLWKTGGERERKEVPMSATREIFQKGKSFFI